MRSEEFIEILDILSQNIQDDTPSNILKNSFHRTPYTILIATLLSLRSKDENTARVVKELFAVANTPQLMLEIPIEKLQEIVKPIGMYRKKAQILYDVSQTLIDRFNSKVPNTQKELLSIKNIGEKTANILLNNAFNIPIIAVDTHVHRIANLLNFIDTKNEKDTQKELSKKIPKEYWNIVNFNIVSFGQTICKPRNPKCDICPISKFCPIYYRRDKR
ncbi:Endonuclease III [hydrothermal vent metagenome]|uniref:Endonuclease III n=1 Tax=hydrothermal vent metagenome TaxID=652676 RepID=A0A1W1EHR7_9ZZZZ